MTRGQDFIKNAKCTHAHRSAMSISAWCDLNKNCTVLNLHDMCHNPKSNCQKQITFSPDQFRLQGAGLKNTMKKNLKALKQFGTNFSNPLLTYQHRLLACQ